MHHNSIIADALCSGGATMPGPAGQGPSAAGRGARRRSIEQTCFHPFVQGFARVGCIRKSCLQFACRKSANLRC